MEFVSMLQTLFVLTLFGIDFGFAATDCPNVNLPNGGAHLKSNGRMVNFRCRGKFELVGHRFAVCLPSGQWSQQIPVCVGTTCEKITELKDGRIKEFNKGGVLKFTCNAGRMRSGLETIMCDGKNWSDQPPKCIDGISLGCDFEDEGLCGWSQDTTDDFDWTWTSGSTSTVKTGPTADHSKNSPEGHYLFIESSAPQLPGDVARFVSPRYSPDAVINMCLEFFYHMFGQDGTGEVGKLDVFVKPLIITTATLDANYSIFHLEGNQGEKWQRADVDIPQQKEAFQLVFQATRLRSWTSDIAIDDIRLFNCSERTTCEKITELKDGRIEEFNKGGVLKFTCNAGRMRSGPETITCDGKDWSDQPPKCIDAADVMDYHSYDYDDNDEDKNNNNNDNYGGDNGDSDYDYGDKSMETSDFASYSTVGYDAHHSSAPNMTQESESPVDDFSDKNNQEDMPTMAPVEDPYDETKVKTGRVGDQEGRSSSSGDTIELLPLIVGIVAAVLVCAVVQ